jgi:VWFA-related protein
LQRISRNHTAVLFLLSIIITFLSIPLCAEENEFTLRGGVNEVRLAFAVSDRQGHIVRDLRAADVAVADNGDIIRHFRSFYSASESPLELIILLDTSDSVASRIPAVIAEVRNFVEKTKWGERDRVSILSFGGLHPELICARNCGAHAAQAKLTALRANGSTPLYDALFKASDILRREHDPEAKPAIILFSDGMDTISMHDVKDAREAAQALQAAIYCVNPNAAKSGAGSGGAILDHLAATTGGLSFAPGQDTQNALCSILADLRSGYVLTYDPPQNGTGQHEVRVLSTADPRLQFRSRRAYDDTLSNP